MRKNSKVFSKSRHTNMTIVFSIMAVTAVALLVASGPIVESQHAMALQMRYGHGHFFNPRALYKLPHGIIIDNGPRLVPVPP